MLQGLQSVVGGDAAVPFVRQLRVTHVGVVHTIVQAEGGEEGDTLMPALFAFGQHPTLQALQAHLQADERLFARPGERHLRGSVVPPLQHPCAPRKDAGLEPGRRGATRH